MIHDLLKIKETGHVFPSRSNRLSARFAFEETGEPVHQPPSFGHQKQYRMTLTLACTFTANDAQRDHKLKHMERALCHELYSDVIRELYAIMNMAEDDEVMKACADLIAKLRDPRS